MRVPTSHTADCPTSGGSPLGPSVPAERRRTPCGCCAQANLGLPICSLWRDTRARHRYGEDADMHWRIGLIGVEGAGHFVKSSKYAWLGAKRAFTVAGGRIDEHAVVLALPIEKIVHVARITGIVLWHVQNVGQTQTVTPRNEGVGAPIGNGFASCDSTVLASELHEGDAAAFSLLNDQVGRLTDRLEALDLRAGGAVPD